jgi:chemotaxis signal transduction protein
MNSLIDENISILVFKAAGVKIGLDTGQILEMMDMKTAAKTAKESGADMKKLNEVVPLGKRVVNFIRPKAIRLKAAGMPLIVIEEPESILDIDIEDIRPMPFVIERLGSKAVWGAAVTGGGIILLVDLFRL